MATVQTTRSVAAKERTAPPVSSTGRRPDFADWILLGTIALVAAGTLTAALVLVF